MSAYKYIFKNIYSDNVLQIPTTNSLWIYTNDSIFSPISSPKYVILTLTGWIFE